MTVMILINRYNDDVLYQSDDGDVPYRLNKSVIAGAYEKCSMGDKRNKNILKI